MFTRNTNVSETDSESLEATSVLIWRDWCLFWLIIPVEGCQCKLLLQGVFRNAHSLSSDSYVANYHQSLLVMLICCWWAYANVSCAGDKEIRALIYIYILFLTKLKIVRVQSILNLPLHFVKCTPYKRFQMTVVNFTLCPPCILITFNN
jgi:hypothetical protein